MKIPQTETVRTHEYLAVVAGLQIQAAIEFRETVLLKQELFRTSEERDRLKNQLAITNDHLAAKLSESDRLAARLKVSENENEFYKKLADKWKQRALLACEAVISLCRAHMKSARKAGEAIGRSDIPKSAMLGGKVKAYSQIINFCASKKRNMSRDDNPASTAR